MNLLTANDILASPSRYFTDYGAANIVPLRLNVIVLISHEILGRQKPKKLELAEHITFYRTYI